MSGASNDVAGRCPACGWKSLFVASGGYITCSGHDCPQPTLVADLLLGEVTWRSLVDTDEAERLRRALLVGIAEHAPDMPKPNVLAIDLVQIALAERSEVTG